MTDLKLLIIVPTLNSYKILWRLINSLEIQTYQNWRVIFVDGHSSSDHISYLNNLKDKDSRFLWVTQEVKNKGIYGAMNQGVQYAKNDEWILFWGSDDWAANKNTFKIIVNKINSFKKVKPYLLISNARYYDIKNFKFKRKSNFSIFSNFSFFYNITFNSTFFNLLMFLGNVPPHQGTLFSPNALQDKNIFNQKLYIAADLYYFLYASTLKGIKINLLNEEIVIMGTGGYSNNFTLKRIKEVFYSYKQSYSFFAFLPFCLRYFKRFISLIIL
tara:strand:- start:808 stop:1623 length:816 start_codon:yes stop_codon:yes gene_type:complete